MGLNMPPKLFSKVITKMKATKILSLPLAFFITLSVSFSQEDISKRALRKIEFEHSTIDDRGYMNGEIMVDYEFCIPKDEKKAAGITAIDPEIIMPRQAKGRIGCSEDQYLCIVSNHTPGWRERLFAIASLPYVKRIIQTEYE